MMLRDEALDDSRPDEHHRDSADQRGRIAPDRAQSRTHRAAVAVADERAPEHEARLSADEDGGDFDDAVREQPAEEEEVTPNSGSPSWRRK